MYIEHIAMYVNDLEKTKRGGRTNIPSIAIFDMEKNTFTEMELKISDYVLLKMYFEKHKIIVKDEFKRL